MGKLARLSAAWCAALALAACGGRGPARIEADEVVQLPSQRMVAVRVLLPTDHASQLPRYMSAVRATLVDYERRFGPTALQSLTLVDVGWQQSPDLPDAIVVRAPWMSPGLAMEPETDVTRAVGLRLWRERLSCGSTASTFVEGLNRYTAMATVASQFAVQQTPPVFAYAHPRYFGEFIPWVLRVPLYTATVGNGLDEYRTHSANPGNPGNGNPGNIVARTALALGTLERWVGAPTWDTVLAEFAVRARSACPSPQEFERTAGEVTGLDLAWFFHEVFESSATFDYGVERFTSEVGVPGGPYRTTVVVGRLGDAQFTGSSVPRTGPFDSGRGMDIVVRFEDGTVRRDVWDGRDRRRTFEYESSSRAQSAEVDPRRVLLLDVNRTNNSAALRAASSGAALKWAGRWAVWFQDFLLTCASLV